MSKIPGELDADKKRFAEMMYRLARMYRTPDGELTSEILSMYWEKLKGYPINVLLKGMDDLLEDHDSRWFPLIPEIKKAALKNADRGPTKRLPKPDDKATPEQLRNNRYNMEWWVLYFWEPCPIATSQRLPIRADKRMHYKTPPELTDKERSRFAPYLREKGDTGHDANRKRQAYVKFRKQIEGVDL